MIITVSGLPGSGISTLARRLAKKLDYPFVSVGDIRKQKAVEMGLTLAEFNKLGEKESWTDVEVDDKIKDLIKKSENLVLDAKIAHYLAPNGFHIFLKGDLRKRSERILENNRKSEKFKSIEEAMFFIDNRVKSDRLRYKQIYDIDSYNENLCNLVIDTSNLSMDEVFENAWSVVQQKI
jgi:CMP/dCMP kinase